MYNERKALAHLQRATELLSFGGGKRVLEEENNGPKKQKGNDGLAVLVESPTIKIAQSLTKNQDLDDHDTGLIASAVRIAIRAGCPPDEEKEVPCLPLIQKYPGQVSDLTTEVPFGKREGLIPHPRFCVALEEYTFEVDMLPWIFGNYPIITIKKAPDTKLLGFRMVIDDEYRPYFIAPNVSAYDIMKNDSSLASFERGGINKWVGRGDRHGNTVEREAYRPIQRGRICLIIMEDIISNLKNCNKALLYKGKITSEYTSDSA